ncbi:MAG: DUF2270 domain-containing protein, partial [Anaerolineae bacterium]|nr:DUF2270 domain-containing protein [Anaerolineae bacterium]
GRRLRRNYAWIYAVLVLSWLTKLWLHPAPTTSLVIYIQRAAIGTIPGWIVMMFFLAYFVFLLILGLVTAGLQQATGEVLPTFGEEAEPISMEDSPFEGEADKEAKDRAWFRRSHRRQQYMCMIITDRS